MRWRTTIKEILTFTFHKKDYRVRIMVFISTFNNISAISWLSVLLVEETGVPWENHWSVASHWQTLSFNVVSSIPCLSMIRTHNDSGDRHIYYWRFHCDCVMKKNNNRNLQWRILGILHQLLSPLSVSVNAMRGMSHSQ